ncbi:MAG TPA: aminotransferase class IV, partial [Mycobacteriales bacterium]|nr:aminotransferase class IV [Mycobacteriales bacterium]
AEFAVTIRSFQIADDRVGLWVGGGITVDSVPIEEWRECLTKASPLLQAAGFRLRQSPTGSREHGTLLPESLVETPVAGVTGPDQLGTGLSVTSQPQPQPQPQSQPQPSRSAVGLSDAAGSGPGPGAARLSDVAGSEPGMARSPEAAAHRPDRSAAGLPDAADGLLETVLVRDGRAVALADHLARLERSCRELYGRPPSELAADVACHAAGETRGRLRIVVRPMADKLDVDITVAPLAGPTGVRRLVTASRPGVVWRHKYADRRWLSAAEHRVGDGALPLFVDVAGQVLETTRGNVFLILGEELLTPPATDAILPGVTRRLVLDAAFDLGVIVRIEPIPLARIHAADGLFTTSAVSEITHIDELDGAALPAAGALERAVADSVLGRD